MSRPLLLAAALACLCLIARPAQSQVGTVLSEAEISGGTGLPDTLDDGDSLGRSAVPLGDLDGDGVADLAVGAPGDSGKGAVWIFFLNVDGTVRSHQKIGDNEGGFAGALHGGDQFAHSLALLGDLDGDGVVDLAVGAPGDDAGGIDQGAAWILFLKSDGAVKSYQKIGEMEGGFAGALDDDDYYGSSVAPLGDLDRDGVVDLAVGAPADDDGGALTYSERGAVWVLFLHPDGTVKSHQKISSTDGAFSGPLLDAEFLGWSLASPGDIDGDGVVDLAAGAPGAFDRGAVWIFFLNVDGTVGSHEKISAGDFAENLHDGDFIGSSVSSVGDLDGDGVVDLAVGALTNHGDGTFGQGTLWLLFLDLQGGVRSYRRITEGEGGFVGPLGENDRFGDSVASLGDLDGDGSDDLAVGASGDDDGGGHRGAMWVLFLGPDFVVRSQQKISDRKGSLLGTLDSGDLFGSSTTSLGDLDGDGVADLAVGACHDNDGGLARGAVWILFLNVDGTVKNHQKVSDTEGGFTGTLQDFDEFGFGVAALGDLDRDGVVDLAVSAHSDGGAVWILFLNPDGTVRSHQKISHTEGGFSGTFEGYHQFGFSIASLGDVDGDGTVDLAVGAPFTDDETRTYTNRGAIWLLFLNPGGTVKNYQMISNVEGGLAGALDDNDFFGTSVASLGDLDGDGVVDLAVGAYGDSDGNDQRGAVWILFLNPDGTADHYRRISDARWRSTGPFFSPEWFASSLTSLGDLDRDGVTDLAVGFPADDDGGYRHGAVWILFLDIAGTVKADRKISDTEGGFAGTLGDFALLGRSVALLGDLDGDGVVDLAAGSPGEADAGAGAIWLLFLEGDTDGDGSANGDDNCRFVANPDQTDAGGVGSGEPDGIGDACQCGDVTGNGIVNGQDGLFIRRFGLGFADPLFRQPGNCDVTGDGRCNAADGFFVARAGLGYVDALFGQNCPNATGAVCAICPQPD